ncbi:hypothetical protein EAH84_11920 [Sphingomonas oligophenolica]|uniref:Tetratricopeptide repeat protein n=1 Tax=Sphingomonas oligophenolica TaxID=301154 RepID=A0A502CFI6_9SPHN|nr:hypothetical protein EAH84_11920 [Sphingomonas oligophenolica]
MLADIQQRIDRARLVAATSGDVSGLADIAASLRAANTARSGPMAYYVPYWLAYTDYLAAGTLLKAARKGEAMQALSEAVAVLTAAPTSDVETDALLSLVAGLRIAVTTPEQIGEAIGQARDALEKAVALDATNVRVLYARALADYTTPKQYGVGRVAEKYARGAIAQPRESTRALKPGWGRDDSAALLVKILRAGGRDDEAQSILTRFAGEYPDSASLHVAAAAPKQP